MCALHHGSRGFLTIEVKRFAPSLAPDFFALHSTPPGECFCSYWWLEEGEDWAKVTADDNRRRREGLLAKGEYDGYLAYADGKVAGWCQVGPRDRLGHLVRKLSLTPDPTVWAISCFYIAPGMRRKGVATALLKAVLTELRESGVRRVEAYPRRGENPTGEDLWNGPEAMLTGAGFRVIRDDPKRPLLGLTL